MIIVMSSTGKTEEASTFPNQGRLKNSITEGAKNRIISTINFQYVVIVNRPQVLQKIQTVKILRITTRRQCQLMFTICREL